MKHGDDTERDEQEAMHRTRCAISEVLARLKVMGLHQMAPDRTGKLRPVDLDPQRRRELLIYLSELEDLAGVLESFKQDLARNIELANRSQNAVSVYHRNGATLKKSARKH
ncbi:hypothetical protein MXD81_41335 [Microbacteriaceae bacterium K1510]|nr:hypothetical protein [Microbacteriaceae bacterium K1510]